MSLRNELRARSGEFTAVERKISAALLADYPFIGLVSIQELADRSHASAPSITRFVGKLGFAGYVEFQRRLIDELKEGSRSPIDLRATQMVDAADGHLQSYGDRVCALIQEAMIAVPVEEFDRICALLGDPKRTVFVIGGRVSNMLATALSMHLRLLRPDVVHISPNPELWPDSIQQMRHRDVLVIFDFRRYQVTLEMLAASASAAAKPQIVLFTDKWLSPIAKRSAHVLPVPTDVGTAWDTATAVLALVEAIVVRVAEKNWAGSQDRMEAWDRLRPFPPRPVD